MHLNLEWLKEFIPGLKIDNKIVDSLTSLGLEVSSVKNKNKSIIVDIDLTPNRGDCLSAYGIARDLNSLFYKKLKYPSLKKLSKTEKSIGNLVSEICPTYACLNIYGINNSIKTPVEIKKRLQDCDVASINFVVDVLNYVMLEIGQPMHVFDLDQLSSPIGVRFAKKTESILGLDNNEYKLSENIPVIYDKSGVIAIAGVLGGLKTSTSAKTKNLLIESAFFEPNMIRQSAKQFRLQTDSSYRFERGVDPKLQATALSRVLQIINKYSSYESSSYDIKTSKKSETRNNKKISLHQNVIAKSLGLNIDPKFIVRTFESLGFSIDFRQDKFMLKTPSHRFDIDNKQDILEEIARVYGYDNFSAVIPSNYIRKLNNNINIPDVLSQLLSHRGYNEIISFTMLPKGSQKLIHKDNEIIKIVNPISEDKAELRASMITSMLQTYKYNQSRQTNSLRLYESGKIYRYKNKKIIEKNIISGIIGG